MQMKMQMKMEIMMQMQMKAPAGAAIMLCVALSLVAPPAGAGEVSGGLAQMDSGTAAIVLYGVVRDVNGNLWSDPDTLLVLNPRNSLSARTVIGITGPGQYEVLLIDMAESDAVRVGDALDFKVTGQKLLEDEGSEQVTIDEIAFGACRRDIRIDGQSGGVDDDTHPLSMPLQVYPNPTMGIATIEYGLEIPDGVIPTVRVLDVRGREVRRLHPAGSYHGRHLVIWDGDDGEGRRAVPGIYFIHLETPERVDRCRVVVLR